jgi:S-adenosylmethionine:tRNA ribosyltransferase-isomerase
VTAVPAPAVPLPVAAERLDFVLPPELEAAEPPEARGLTRDAVRMMVAHLDTGELVDSTFSALPTFLDEGDLVVVNTSGTIPAAIDASDAEGRRLVVHLSTHVGGRVWVVEPRRPAHGASGRWSGPPPRSPLALADGGVLRLVSPYGAGGRLFTAELLVPGRPLTWLAVHGRPIRYRHVRRPWPLAAYQNVYVTEPGSAEMPSAGRPFTPEVVTRLVAKGVGVAPVVLHTGVASLESDELPYPERLRVPAATAERVNGTRRSGGRVVAVGTTVVRALETAAGPDGRARPVDGWTDLVVTPERGVRLVDGLLTGWHEPASSHLLMLEAIAGRAALEASYRHSLDEGYRFHEFGDVHLILP